MRQVVLDTETTGLEVREGHRIIEIGCVELVNRRLSGRHYHQYIQPERDIDAGAEAVHGISASFLADKPVFAEIASDFLEFVQGAELIIHNAPFDVGFLNAELGRLQGATGVPENLDAICSVTDTLQMARRMFTAQKNNLDALCRRFDIDNSHRELHGALLDAEILAEVYLAMTSGQVGMVLSKEEEDLQKGVSRIRRVAANRPPLPVIEASAEEQAAHAAFLEMMRKQGATPLWDQEGS
ncbi:MAG: DNA polymerase III subunit epsilon [Gammaproteobacteria bacterium]|jgi:DNA polymerase-3 subunit epsilon